MSSIAYFITPLYIKLYLFSILAGEFFQNNYFVLPLLVDHVVRMARGDDCDRLIDAYCGSGLFALSAAKHFESVWGVEISDIATNAARETAKMNGYLNIRTNHVIFLTYFPSLQNHECTILFRSVRGNFLERFPRSPRKDSDDNRSPAKRVRRCFLAATNQVQAEKGYIITTKNDHSI